MKSNLAIERKSLAEEVVSRLRQSISSGAFSVGEKLPIEADLMKMYGVGRSTIREAIKVLSNSGFLSVKQGSGTFVVSSFAANEPISMRLKRAQSSDLDEIRQILEMKIAEKAALKRTKTDLKKIRVCLAEIKKANFSGNLENCISADILFHTALASASHNDILLELYQLASEHLDKYYKKIYDSAEVFKTAFALHEKLCFYIENGDAKEAWNTAEEIIKHGQV